jgi:hypothetical protein
VNRFAVSKPRPYVGFNSLPDVGSGLLFGLTFGVAALQRRADRKDASVFILLIDHRESILFHCVILGIILTTSGQGDKCHRLGAAYHGEAIDRVAGKELLVFEVFEPGVVEEE